MSDSPALPPPPPCSHTAELRVWAVDIRGWAEALQPATPSSSSASSTSTTWAGKGTPVDAVIEVLFGNDDDDCHLNAAASDDMRRAGVKIRKYMREADRVRSLAGQLLPRVMLMHEYPHACTWTNLRFDATKEKRPFLAEPVLHDATDYNVTHDGDWIALAFHSSSSSSSSASPSLTTPAPASPHGSSHPETPPLPHPRLRVGCDVMAISLPSYDRSVTSFLSVLELAITPAEKAWVLSAEGEEEEMLMRLYDLWTYKEALTKNMGRGLGFDFSTIEIAFWRCAAVPLRREGSESESKGDAEAEASRRTGSSALSGAAARVHASRTSTRQLAASTPAATPLPSPPPPILTLAGRPGSQYSFLEIHLPSIPPDNKGPERDRRPRSQLVVCEGPYPSSSLSPPPQIAPALEAADAVTAGLLRIWTMGELVAEARRLRLLR